MTESQAVTPSQGPFSDKELALLEEGGFPVGDYPVYTLQQLILKYDMVWGGRNRHRPIAGDIGTVIETARTLHNIETIARMVGVEEWKVAAILNIAFIQYPQASVHWNHPEDDKEIMETIRAFEEARLRELKRG